MSRPYLVYRCTNASAIKKPEAVISLWDEDVPRFSEILDEATSSRPDRARKENEYWEIVVKEKADPYDWEKVVKPVKSQNHDPLGDMWRERARIAKLVDQGATLEQALEAMTPFSHSFRYETKAPKSFLPRMDEVKNTEE